MLIVATALISYRQFALVGTQPGIVAERAAAADPASAISIAVLPFLNLSGDANQEFFSDGMTEEITSALAMVPDLKVVARTSAFQFKGEKNDMRAVGQALNATHLIEGSVRKDGDRVRITAQLIEVGKGTHLWSENYDRQLSDIFATQEEIARTIVGSLMAPLGLAPGERLVSNRTIDPESYEQYLRARTIYRRGKAMVRSLARLQCWNKSSLAIPAMRRPGRCWRCYDVGSFRTGRKRPQEKPFDWIPAMPPAMPRWRRSSFATATSRLAKICIGKRSRWIPMNPTFWTISNRLAAVGRIKEALSLREKLRTLEPFAPQINYITASIMLIGGQGTAAIPILEALPASAGGPVHRLVRSPTLMQRKGGLGRRRTLSLQSGEKSRRIGGRRRAAYPQRSNEGQSPEALPALDKS